MPFSGGRFVYRSEHHPKRLVSPQTVAPRLVLADPRLDDLALEDVSHLIRRHARRHADHRYTKPSLHVLPGSCHYSIVGGWERQQAVAISAPRAVHAAACCTTTVAVMRPSRARDLSPQRGRAFLMCIELTRPCA